MMKKEFLRSKAPLWAVCLILSIFTLIAFHIPFFRVAVSNIESGFNGVMIIVSLAVLMLALNFFLYYFLLWCFRVVGKIIVALSLIIDAGCLYFINTYDTLLDDTMMGNVFNTQYSEASGFFSLAFVLYLLLLGVIPAIYVILRKIDYSSAKRMFAFNGSSLGLVLIIALANMSNWPWIDRNATVLGSLLLPWSYSVNSIRYQIKEHKMNREEILLPDAVFTEPDEKRVCVLVIGESARQDHFSLYGYPRQTNPLLSNQERLTAIRADAAATYTTAGVKAILDSRPTDKLYEILPNYLYRAGAEVVWRTSNWGEPPVHIEKYQNPEALLELYPHADPAYDGILFEGLKDEILSSGKSKVLLIIHTSISHGPAYNKRYPAEFEHFTPVCNTVEMAKADHDELMNSYDNTIIYTDYLLSEAIKQLEELPKEWESCLMYVSDHGESLGEGNLFMHGVPISIAPREQIEIPFLVWTSEGSRDVKTLDKVGQYHVFHSVMSFLGAESEVFDEKMNIFASGR